MIRTERQLYIFQKDWTGNGERGIRDQMLMPAIFFGAVSPGLFLSSVIFDYIPGLWLSITLNFVGYGLTHLLYLGRMERFWRGLANIRTSWISRGLLFNILFSITSLLYTLSATFTIPVLNVSGVNTTLKIAGIISAILFAAYPGFMLSFVKAIPFWRSLLEPALFFLQAIMAGTAIHILSFAFTKSGYGNTDILTGINFILMLTVLLLIMTALVMKSLHGEAERVSVRHLTIGGLSTYFLGGALFAGLVVPIFALSLIFAFGLDLQRFEILLYSLMVFELTGVYLCKYSIIRAGVYTPALKSRISI